METNGLVDINAPTPEINPGLVDVPSAPLITPHSEKAIYIAKHNSHIQPVRTFSSDLADAVREQGGSVVRIAIAENEKQQKEYKEASITSRKNIVFTILGFILVVAAIIAVAWVYIQKTKPAPVTQVPTVATSVIFSENSQKIDMTGMQPHELISAINAIVIAPNIQSGTIKNIVIANGGVQTTASQFIDAIGATHTPSDFARSLSNEYMIGTYLYNDDNLFFVVKGSAHDFLLSGILEWEPFMLTDLAPLFDVDTSGTNARLLDTKWSDVVLDNHDARAILDTNGKPVFFYTFIDPNTILFAKNPKIITTLVSRF